MQCGQQCPTMSNDGQYGREPAIGNDAVFPLAFLQSNQASTSKGSSRYPIEQHWKVLDFVGVGNLGCECPKAKSVVVRAMTW